MNLAIRMLKSKLNYDNITLYLTHKHFYIFVLVFSLIDPFEGILFQILICSSLLPFPHRDH